MSAESESGLERWLKRASRGFRPIQVVEESRPVGKPRNAGLAAVFALLLLFTTSSCRLSDELDAKTTATQMREIVALLQEGNDLCDINCLKTRMKAFSREDLLIDAWGNEIQVSTEKGPEHFTYTVRSLGKDGVKGSCCEKWVDSFSDDAVLQNNQWLQVWR